MSCPIIEFNLPFTQKLVHFGCVNVFDPKISKDLVEVCFFQAQGSPRCVGAFAMSRKVALSIGKKLITFSKLKPDEEDNRELGRLHLSIGYHLLKEAKDPLIERLDKVLENIPNGEKLRKGEGYIG